MRQRVLYRSIAALAAFALLTACSEEQQQPAAPPPPTVEVIEVRSEPVENIVELPGRVQAVAIAEVRARVNGIIQERLYEEGSDVKAGQPLFKIDPREMQAALNSAQAALEGAEATAANTARDVRRYEELVERGAISQQDYDTAVARLRTAQAEVSQARSAVETAELNLGYTRVESPIDGVAGRAEVTIGALVSAANGTLLTRVEQFDPVYVNFSQSSSDLLAIRAQFASGQLALPEDGRVPVDVILENGQRYPHSGYVDFYAMSIDRSTGTVAIRAQVPNPDRLLLPGQFVRARVTAGTRAEGVVIPQRAVIMSQRGASVMVLGEDDVVATREVMLGSMRGSDWIVREGLETGDRVIVEGGQNARAGAPVKPVPFVQDDAEARPVPADPATAAEAQ